MRRLFAGILAGASLLSCPAKAITPSEYLSTTQHTQAPLFWDFVASNAIPSWLTFTRASAETTALYTDAAGSAYTSFASAVPAITSAGLQIYYGTTTQYFLQNSAQNGSTIATQSAINLPTGTYVLWCTGGTGTSVLSAAVTAVGTGFSSQTCSSNSYQTIVITTAGTVSVTVTGTSGTGGGAGVINRVQLEKSSVPTPLIETSASTASRVADIITFSAASISYFQVPFCVVAEFTIPTYVSTVNLFGGSKAPGLTLGSTSGGQALITYAGISGSSTAVSTSPLTNGVIARAGGVFNPTGYMTSINGSVPVTGTSKIAVGYPASMSIGSVGGSITLNGNLSKIVISPGANYPIKAKTSAGAHLP
jgi:hypothetical protein